MVVWLDNLWKSNSVQYNQIVKMGLAEFREQCGTVGELLERFIPYAINGQEPKLRTSKNRRTACNSFLYFLAKQRVGNFRHDERALKLASNIPVKEITPEIAGKYYAMIQKTYQPTTWGRRIKQVKTMFSLAV